MRGVGVSPDNSTASVQGGCLLGDVDAATAQHGMIVPAGIVSETGVGGIALGGGIGWFSCKRALTCDNFLSLKLVTVSESQHADLFWALHGDGGWEMH